ncbi:amidase [Fusarium agapanthi]|uniref:Amidase n=1 Tax=Fusarium agapanthi TaxID=1803897 RepID=A0A9P5BIB2_9HYPO|nr:amidase [Fusarium agapanthi]
MSKMEPLPPPLFNTWRPSTSSKSPWLSPSRLWLPLVVLFGLVWILMMPIEPPSSDGPELTDISRSQCSHSSNDMAFLPSSVTVLPSGSFYSDYSEQIGRPRLPEGLADRLQSLGTKRVALVDQSKLGLDALTESPYFATATDFCHIDIAGAKTFASPLAYGEFHGIKSQNAHAIQRLLDLGAVIVGKTGMSQFAGAEDPTGDFVDFHAPWNPRGDALRSPGGSSYGSGTAAGAYDWIDFTIGTDTGGSVRQPAASQSVYGLRPSKGASSVEGTVVIHSTRTWEKPLLTFEAREGSETDQRIMLTKSTGTVSQKLHIISTASTENSRYVSPEFLGLLKTASPIATAIAPATPDVGSFAWGSVILLAKASQLAWNELRDFD